MAGKDDPTKDVGMWATRLPPRQWTKDVFSPIRFPAGILFPTGQKDPDGNWTVSYTGTTCFIFNDAAIEGLPYNLAGAHGQ